QAAREADDARPLRGPVAVARGRLNDADHVPADHRTGRLARRASDLASIEREGLDANECLARVGARPGGLAEHEIAGGAGLRDDSFHGRPLDQSLASRRLNRFARTDNLVLTGGEPG